MLGLPLLPHGFLLEEALEVLTGSEQEDLLVQNQQGEMVQQYSHKPIAFPGTMSDGFPWDDDWFSPSLAMFLKLL